MHNPQAVLSHERLRTLLDPDQPVAVLFISVLHFTSDASRIVARFRQFMAPGSYLAQHPGNTWAELTRLADAPGHEMAERRPARGLTIRPLHRWPGRTRHPGRRR
jgi:trans-aconitate methyltransferase